MLKISKTELISLQKKLKTDVKIAKKFGVTHQRIQQLRVAYGIPSIWADNEERNVKIIALRKQGVPSKKIAKKIGLSLSTVNTIIHFDNL